LCFGVLVAIFFCVLVAASPCGRRDCHESTNARKFLMPCWQSNRYENTK
jgi:hypothetical protein